MTAAPLADLKTAHILATLYGSVPLRFIQTWHSRAPRGWYGRLLQQAHRTNPDLELWLYDDADGDAFVARTFPLVWQSVWPHLTGRYRIQRYDLLRLLTVLHHGGLYLDMDVEVLLPFGRLLAAHSAIFAIEEVISPADCR